MKYKFWSTPTAVHRFDASDMVVPGQYIPWSNSKQYSEQF